MKRVLVISLAAVLALSLSIVLLPAQPATAGGVFEVPSDYLTIQAGINAAEADGGGTVLVAASTYYENIELKDGVEVVGDGPSDTIISGVSSDPQVPVVTANQRTDAKLDGFTITNGSGTQSGAGIAIQVNSSNVTISNCVITGNTADLSGGGIAIDDSSATIVNCTIIGNTANKIDEWGGNGGGIYITNSSPTIINCIIANNTAINAGGGIYVSSGSSPTINYNNVWGNSLNNYSGYSPGSDDISGDPLFVNPGGGDYHLQSGSPCIDAGDNSAPGLPDTDKDGNPRIVNDIVDMGAYEATAINIIIIEIDIKPGSFPNSINPNSKGVIPVAILTIDDFDAATVDSQTVVFGPAGAAPVHYALEDVDDDSDIDMILHFGVQEVGLDTEDKEATLTGQTSQGQIIEGTDSVRVVPKGNK